MILARNLLLLAIDLCCSMVYAETELHGYVTNTFTRGGNDIQEPEFTVECNMLEQFRKEERISELDYEARLNDCKDAIFKDVSPTETMSEDDKGELKIYFTDEDVNNSETYKLINDRPIAATEHGGSHLQNILLTSNDDKQINSRHELYKNPKTPQIKFRTEPPSSLRSVASPLLVQNSVRNKLHERAARLAKRKRDSKNQQPRPDAGSNRGKRSLVDGASWFKKYQAVYKSMAQKRSQYQNVPYAMPPQATGPNYYAQNQINNAGGANIPNIRYAYNYVYPLYHLHSRDKGYNTRYNVPGYDLRAGGSQLRYQPGKPAPVAAQSLTGVVDTREFLSGKPAAPMMAQTTFKDSRKSGEQFTRQQTNLPQLSLNSKNVVISRNNIAKAIQGTQMTAFSAPAQDDHGLAQEHVLHKIGLKDDASFMGAKASYERGALTLHAAQSILPRSKVHSPDLSVQKDTGDQDSGLPSSRLSFLKLPQAGKALKDNDVTTQQQQQQQQQQRSTIARPGAQNGHINNNDIALSFYSELRRPTISFPEDDSDEKRDVIFSKVNPSSDIDSDDVTAENLAAIFNELDGEVDHVLDGETARESISKKSTIAKTKSDVARPQDEIEMTVYDSSTDKQKKNSVHFVKSIENETNFEQSLGISPMDTDDTTGTVIDHIQNRKFNLSQLHFGLKNGNTFE